jgi:hypothetical protein
VRRVFFNNNPVFSADATVSPNHIFTSSAHFVTIFFFTWVNVEITFPVLSYLEIIFSNTHLFFLLMWVSAVWHIFFLSVYLVIVVFMSYVEIILYIHVSLFVIIFAVFFLIYFNFVFLLYLKYILLWYQRITLLYWTSQKSVDVFISLPLNVSTFRMNRLQNNIPPKVGYSLYTALFVLYLRVAVWII